ncbi:MAG: histidine kinase [Aequorivita sp.]|nr:histidine kinase [Aequorivita sp.]
MEGNTGFFLLWSFVTSGMLTLFLLSMLIYWQSKQRVFLFYGLYNIFLFVYLATKIPYFFDEIYTQYITSRYGAFNYYIQIIYNSFLFLFYTEFLNFKKYFTGFNRFIIKYLWIQFFIASLLFIYSAISAKPNIFHDIYIFGFMPIITTITAYGLYISFKIPNKRRYFIIVGVLFYYFFGYIAIYKSSGIDYQPPPLTYYYIGIILESIIFMIGLGYWVKVLYLEKIKSQNNIIEQQIEKQRLKEAYQLELETKLSKQKKELKETLKKLESDRLQSITAAFEKEITLLKLESLRSQMNPHFIFNALNSIKVYFIENEKEKAIYYLNKFSKLIRKILESSRADSITLEEELDILKLYMSIENLRFQKKIDFTINIAPEVNVATIKTPALILQPFIENALWHGLSLQTENKEIEILVTNEKDIVKISIRDNGMGREMALERKSKKKYNKESLGLKFVNERLENFNKKNETKYSFKIIDLYGDKKNPTGTLIEFLLQ